MNLLKKQLVPIDKVRNFFSRVRNALEEYMAEERLADKFQRDVVSFSLALPRLFSTLIYHQLRYYPEINVTEHLNQITYQNGLISDALNTITRMHEIRSGLWVRNGHTIVRLVTYYRSPRFAGQTFDFDLHGLQLAFSRKAAQGQCYAVLEALCEASKTTQLNGLWLSQENHKEADKLRFNFVIFFRTKN